MQDSSFVVFINSASTRKMTFEIRRRATVRDLSRAWWNGFYTVAPFFGPSASFESEYEVLVLVPTQKSGSNIDVWQGSGKTIPPITNQETMIG